MKRADTRLAAAATNLTFGCQLTIKYWHLMMKHHCLFCCLNICPFHGASPHGAQLRSSNVEIYQLEDG